MFWTDIVSAISAMAAAITGIIASIFATWKFVNSKNFDFESNRPFIIPRYEVFKSTSGVMNLYLVLKNVGDTPAQNVLLDFTSDGAWNWVRNPKYPFISSNQSKGLTAIGPSDEVSYFVGVIREGNPISDLGTREVEGIVSFDNPRRGKRIQDKFRLSLDDNRYKAK